MHDAAPFTPYCRKPRLQTRRHGSPSSAVVCYGGCMKP
jgi:hypothetical protein